MNLCYYRKNNHLNAEMQLLRRQKNVFEYFCSKSCYLFFFLCSGSQTELMKFDLSQSKSQMLCDAIPCCRCDRLWKMCARILLRTDRDANLSKNRRDAYSIHLSFSFEKYCVLQQNQRQHLNGIMQCGNSRE